MTLSYEEIFSRYRGRINDPKELALDESDLTEICIERLHTVIGDSRVAIKFSNVIFDDELQQVIFKLKYPTNDFADKEYVIKLLSMGMEIEWLKPQVDSRVYTASMIGGKEEKMLQNNYKPMIDRLEKLEQQFSRQLSNHGYINNAYLRGDA